jgi:hypothetical protein
VRDLRSASRRARSGKFLARRICDRRLVSDALARWWSQEPSGSHGRALLAFVLGVHGDGGVLGVSWRVIGSSNSNACHESLSGLVGSERKIAPNLGVWQ